MPSFVVSTVAVSDPLTAAEANLHLRLNSATASADSAIVTRLIAAATEEAQAFTGKQFVDATFDWTLPCFRDPRTGDTTTLTLPRCPVDSITHVKYYDTANTQQTLAAANYYTIGLATTTTAPVTPCRLVLVSTSSWPSLYDRQDAVEIRFKAGYSADSTSVPAAIKAAILMMVDDLYNNRCRQGEALTINPAVMRLLRPFQSEFV